MLSDTYDTVVVGAGLTGALVAHHLAEAGQRVAVLEAKRAPGGAAAKGAGMAFVGTPEPYAALQARLGADEARQTWQLTRQNLDLLTATLEKVQQQVTPAGSLRLAADAAEATLLQESVTLLRQDLYAAELEEELGDLARHGYLAGLRTTADLAFAPEALTVALLDHTNITVEYETEVQTIRPAQHPAGTKALSIWARKHYLHAQNAILANGAYAAHLCPGLARIISPLPMHAIDLRCETAATTPLLIQRGHVAAHAHETGWRMVGWSNAGADSLYALAGVAQQLCPDAPVLARHSWWAAQSVDGMPVVGPTPDMPNVYVVNGLGPCGWSWVCIAVERLLGALLRAEKIGALALNRFSMT